MFLFFFFTSLFQQIISNFGDAKDSSKCSAEYEVIRNERGPSFLDLLPVEKLPTCRGMSQNDDDTTVQVKL